MIISFRNTEGGEVWYTTDGSKPVKGGENSTKYIEPFTIDNEKLINAALFTDDGKMSPVVNYSIEDTFTKGETRALLKHKADKSEVYTKAEVEELVISAASGNVDLSQYETKADVDEKLASLEARLTKASTPQIQTTYKE